MCGGERRGVTVWGNWLYWRPEVNISSHKEIKGAVLNYGMVQCRVACVALPRDTVWHVEEMVEQTGAGKTATKLIWREEYHRGFAGDKAWYRRTAVEAEWYNW